MSAKVLLVVAAQLVVAGAHATTPPSQLPIYPGVIHTRIGNDMVVAGHPLRMAYFTTPDGLDTVASYFEKLWKEEGYPTFVDREGDEAVVSAFLTRQGLQRSVVLKRQGELTLAFTVVRDLWIRVLKKPGGEGTLLAFEGAVFSEDFGLDDGQGTSRTRSQIVPGKLQEVRADLMKRMTLRGMTLTRESGQKVEGQQQLVIEHAAPGEQVVSVLSNVKSDGQFVAVSQVWVGSDRPDAVPNDTAVRDLRERMKKEKKK